MSLRELLRFTRMGLHQRLRLVRPSRNLVIIDDMLEIESFGWIRWECERHFKRVK